MDRYATASGDQSSRDLSSSLLLSSFTERQVKRPIEVIKIRIQQQPRPSYLTGTQHAMQDCNLQTVSPNRQGKDAINYVILSTDHTARQKLGRTTHHRLLTPATPTRQRENLLIAIKIYTAFLVAIKNNSFSYLRSICVFCLLNCHRR